MTAYLAVRQSDRVHLLVDGAYLSPEDRTVAIVGPKAIEFHHIRAALTIRGKGGSPMFTLARLFDRFSSFDDLIAKIPEHFKSVRAVHDGHWEVVLVGISEKRGPEMYLSPPGDEALHKLEHAYCGLRVEFPLPVWGEGFDPLVHGVGYFQKLRETPAPPFDSPDGPATIFHTGGWITHTLITADKMETKKIYEWPDVIGERIDPTREGHYV